MTVDASGFTAKTKDEVLSEIKAEIFSSPNLNPNGRINLGADSVLGILVEIISDKFAELYQVMQAVYSSQYLFSAENQSLNDLVALIGASRLMASASTATLTASGVNGTIITAGTIIRDPSRTSIDWIVTANQTISGGTATLNVQCATAGPISANAGTLTDIATPIGGFNTVTNPLDATIGTNTETDEALRERFINLLASSGSSTLAAIRSALLAVNGVTEAYVYENMENVTNTYGVPPHAIECVVNGGSANDIAQAIMENKAAGIGTYTANANSGIAVDDNAQNVTINFSRPVNVNCYIYAEIQKSDINTNIEAELEAALVAFGDSGTVGQTVIRSRFIGEAYKIGGVINVRRLAISRTGQPTSGSPVADFLNDIALAFRERASFDTTRCVIAFV